MDYKAMPILRMEVEGFDAATGKGITLELRRGCEATVGLERIVSHRGDRKLRHERTETSTA